MTLREFKDRHIFWTTTLFTLVATIADTAVAWRAARLGATDTLRVAVSSAAWAVLVSAAATALLLLLGFFTSLASRDPRRRLRIGVAGAAVPVMAALVVLGLDLLSGTGISGKSWVGMARVGWIVVATLGFLLFAEVAASLLWMAEPRRRSRFRTVAEIVIPLGVVVALVADARIYPKLYPAGHLLLWLGIFVALLALAAIPAGEARPNTRTLAGSVGLMIGCSVIVLLYLDPLSDAPVARAAAYRETLFLKRALTHLKPTARSEPTLADPELVRALRAAKSVDAALLDRALPGRRRMNVLVISIDAVRADRLSRNGYARRLMPNLEGLIASGTYFKNAWTTYPFTLMAFASAFRGVYASATDGWRYREAGFDRLPWAPQPTVASILGARGFRTEAIVGFPRFIREALEREEGFAHFNAHVDPRWRERSLVAEEITTLAIDALDRDPGTPFLLWVHYFDPHAPYEPPPPHPFSESKPDLYDAEMAYADRELGKLLDALRARQLLASTAIVFFSDHGEDLAEFDHGTGLTEEQIHVPMALVLPGLPPNETAIAVDLTDIAPTILELVGVEKPSHFHGQSLLSCALLGDAREPGQGLPPDLAFCELGCKGFPQPPQLAARSGPMKIIYHADSQTYALFDIGNDPRESRDLSRDSPDALAGMRRVLDSFRALVADTPTATTTAPTVPK